MDKSKIIIYINANKQKWVAWTADFSGPLVDMPMQEYPLTMTKEEVREAFMRDAGLN